MKGDNEHPNAYFQSVRKVYFLKYSQKIIYINYLLNNIIYFNYKFKIF